MQDPDAAPQKAQQSRWIIPAKQTTQLEVMLQSSALGAYHHDLDFEVSRYLHLTLPVCSMASKVDRTCHFTEHRIPRSWCDCSSHPSLPKRCFRIPTNSRNDLDLRFAAYQYMSLLTTRRVCICTSRCCCCCIYTADVTLSLKRP